MSQCTSRTSWSARARTQGLPGRGVAADPVGQQVGGDLARPGRPRRPRGGSRPGGRPARRCRRPVRAGRAPARPAPGPAGRSRGAGCPWWRRRRGRGACPRRPRAGSPPSRRRRTTPAGPAQQLVRADQGQRGDLAPEQLRGLRVQLGADGLDERPRAVVAHQPGRAAGRHAADLVGGLDDRRAELVGHPVADVLGHGRPRRPDADCAGAHQPRRSPSHCHSTSPCHRWWSRM